MIPYLYDSALDWIEPNSRVLDIGTGDGAFLERVVQDKNCRAVGVERERDLVARCIERGLTVHHGDVMSGLDQYSDKSFDYILLIGTFQEVLEPEEVLSESLRVAKNVIVAYNNFAYWKIRLQMLLKGRVPVITATPHTWYDSPNLSFFSVLDFKDFCRHMKVKEIKSEYFHRHGHVNFPPNLMAEFVLTLLRE